MTTGYWARLDRTVSSWHYVIDGKGLCNQVIPERERLTLTGKDKNKKCLSCLRSLASIPLQKVWFRRTYPNSDYFETGKWHLATWSDAFRLRAMCGYVLPVSALRNKRYNQTGDVIPGGQTCLSCEKVSEQNGDAERIHRAKHLADSLEIAQAVVRLIEREIENEHH